MYPNAYNSYRQTQIQTASPERLLVLLYDGAIRYARQAATAIEKGDTRQANEGFVRCTDIITELMSTLNFEAGEIADNLYRLYEYLNYRLLQANLKRDSQMVNEVVGHLSSLREAWVQISATPVETAPATRPAVSVNA